MNYRRSIAAVGLAGVLAFVVACGSEDQVTAPAGQPRVVAPSPQAAYEHYYDVTHPAPKVRLNGDAKDHPGFGQIESRPAIAPGDAKDHPAYGQIEPEPGPVGTPDWPGDAKDHSGFGGGAGGQVRYALVAPAQPLPENYREVFVAELSALAAQEGVTGLSPAFLQSVDAGGSDSDIWSTPR
jgi:hypothetical protein